MSPTLATGCSCCRGWVRAPSQKIPCKSTPAVTSYGRLPTSAPLAFLCRRMSTAHSLYLSASPVPVLRVFDLSVGTGPRILRGPQKPICTLRTSNIGLFADDPDLQCPIGISTLLVDLSVVCTHGAFRLPEDLFWMSRILLIGFLSFLGDAASFTVAAAAPIASRV